ncbi:hypothetical protein BDZ90DRAFT_229854 [Jaminaea rosea]|uniref:Efficient mitochondria targeting-associated protein 19 n=1 Tax=Jaminaea rosea TaxID=1569628 RepID=A0A316V3T7_9BASI|nr:hypothetical protein BDZ90DRAFT_229854 [Jaminaea rosea]PWN30863.1 hypothetical protein BDZ90DRAFT_229854 [Jaminaea rosea]
MALRQKLWTHRRKADWLYVAFMGVHLLASVLVDGQLFYPQSCIPEVLVKTKQDYLRQSNDPMVGKLGQPEVAWFWMAVVLEMTWQCPAFVLGIVGLVRDDWRVWPLLVGYSSLAFSSTLFVIWQVIAGPDAPSLSSEQLRFLLQNYVPFALMPLMMLIDLTIRCTVALAYAQCKLATTIRSDKKTS